MTTPRRRSAHPVAEAQARRAGNLDAGADALARRQEEFRRFLVSVVGPAFVEIRSVFRADGCEVRIHPAAPTGPPSEARLEVFRAGRLEFSYAVGAELEPERAVVLKRRTVPDPGGGLDATRIEETPLVAGTVHASDARTITRADVVASVRSDYRSLRRSPRPR